MMWMKENWTYVIKFMYEVNIMGLTAKATHMELKIKMISYKYRGYIAYR